MSASIRRGLAAALLIVLCSSTWSVAGDDQRDRDARAALALAAAPKKCDAERARDARAALALSAEVSAPVVAPAPKPKAKPSGCPCCSGCDCGPTCPCAKKSDVNAVRDSVVRVRTKLGSGSGTVIWSDGTRSVVLTAAHVVVGGDVTVRGAGATHTATVLARDDGQDLAALLVPAGLPAIAVTEADHADGTEVLMVGLTSLWSRGRITGRHRLGSADVWELSYESDSGDSGGGVFVGGKLAGVHCGKVGTSKDGGGAPYCATAPAVRKFLATAFTRDGAPVTIAAAPAKPTPTAKRILYYRQVCDNGRCVLVPVYEP